MENEKRWKTKKGFDLQGKTENWNEHPKKPHPAILADLSVPYIIQKNETKKKLLGDIYNPADEGKPIFASKVKNKKTFSDAAYF